MFRVMGAAHLTVRFWVGVVGIAHPTVLGGGVVLGGDGRSPSYGFGFEVLGFRRCVGIVLLRFVFCFLFWVEKEGAVA